MHLVALVFALQVGLTVAGDAWIPLTPPQAQMGSSVLATDPFNPDTLYADAFSVNGIGKSTDGGKTWTLLPFFSRGLLRKIIVERSAPNRVTALTWDDPDQSVHRSSDGGMTWSSRHFSSAVASLVVDLAIDPRQPNTLYAAHEHICLDVNHCVRDSGGISKSTDGGAHWTALIKGIDMEQVLTDPFGGGSVYAGSEFSNWLRSRDEGRTWAPLGVTGAERVFRMELDPVVPGTLYASTFEGGLWRSDDEGSTWTRLGTVFEYYGVPAWSIAVDPTNRQTIVVGGGSSSGARRSTDGGRTWTPLNDGLLGFDLAPTQLAWIRVLFASNGKLYGAADLGGAMMLQTPPPPRGRSVRH
jgi:photosystem II stability/assembly factor-like uncharacterized protein